MISVSQATVSIFSSSESFYFDFKLDYQLIHDKLMSMRPKNKATASDVAEKDETF